MAPEAEKKQEIPQATGTTPDIFAIQKTNILSNPEFQGLEKETKNVLNNITTHYQQPGETTEEQKTNQKIIDFLQTDNNLEKIFQDYAEEFLKDKSDAIKEMRLKRAFGVIKDKILDNYNTYKEAVVQDKEAVVQDKEAVVQDKEAVKQTTQQESQTIQQENQTKEKYRESLFENIKPQYENLQKKTPISIDKNSPEYKNLQDNTQLKESFGGKFEDFITYQYVATKIAQEVQKDPEKKVSSENYKFIQSFNAIAREYGQQEVDTKERKIIPEERLTRSISDFTNHPNTSAVLEQNQNINNYIDNTKTNIKINETSLPKEDIFQKQALKIYGEEIKKELKNKNINYDNIFDKKGEKIENERKKLSPEEQKNIENTINKYSNNIKSDLNSSLQKLITSKTIAGCTNEFVRYFDFNKQEGNYGDMEFDINKINIENGNLQKTMNFKGSETVFNYNLGSGEIQNSDFLNIKDNTVIFGTNQFEDFPIKFPSIQSVQEQAKNQILDQEKISEIFEESQNIEDFYQRYSEKIGNINVDNQESPYIKIVIERTIQKNKILQDTKNLVDKFNEAKNQYDNIEDKEITNMYKILDTSLDNYSIDEMEKFKDYLGKLNNEIQQNLEQTTPNTDPVQNTLFNQSKLNNDKKGEYKKTVITSEKDSRIGPSIPTFLNAISKLDPKQDTETKIVNLHLFKNIVEKREKNESLSAKETTNPEYIDLIEKCTNPKEESQLAGILDLDDPNTRPPSPVIQQFSDRPPTA